MGLCALLTGTSTAWCRAIVEAAKLLATRVSVSALRTRRSAITGRRPGKTAATARRLALESLLE